MKLTKKAATLLALTAAALLATTGQAQNATVSYTDGDLLIGFRVISGTGQTQDLLTDLGSISNFLNLAPGTVVTFTGSMSTPGFNAIGNLGADLTSTFGADYYTRVDSTSLQPVFRFGAVATAGPTDPVQTLYATKAIPAPTYTRAGAGTQVVATSAIGGQGVNGYDQNTSTANSNYTLLQNNGDLASYRSYQPGGVNSGGVSYGYFVPSVEQTGASLPLSLDRITPGSGPSQNLGSFALGSDGTLTFTAVPEPSTYAMAVLGMGMAVAFSIFRRRRLVG